MKKLKTVLIVMLCALFAQISHVTTFDGYSFNQTRTIDVSVEGTGFTKFKLPVYPVNAIPGEPTMGVDDLRPFVIKYY